MHVTCVVVVSIYFWSCCVCVCVMRYSTYERKAPPVTLVHSPSCWVRSWWIFYTLCVLFFDPHDFFLCVCERGGNWSRIMIIANRGRCLLPLATCKYMSLDIWHDVNANVTAFALLMLKNIHTFFCLNDWRAIKTQCIITMLNNATSCLRVSCLSALPSPFSCTRTGF